MKESELMKNAEDQQEASTPESSGKGSRGPNRNSLKTVYQMVQDGELESADEFVRKYLEENEYLDDRSSSWEVGKPQEFSRDVSWVQSKARRIVYQEFAAEFASDAPYAVFEAVLTGNEKVDRQLQLVSHRGPLSEWVIVTQGRIDYTLGAVFQGRKFTGIDRLSRYLNKDQTTLTTTCFDKSEYSALGFGVSDVLAIDSSIPHHAFSADGEEARAWVIIRPSSGTPISLKPMSKLKPGVREDRATPSSLNATQDKGRSKQTKDESSKETDLEELVSNPVKLGLLHSGLGARVAEFRSAAGILPAELAARIGVRPAVIEALESGSIDNLTLDRLLQIARTLRISLSGNIVPQPDGWIASLCTEEVVSTEGGNGFLEPLDLSPDRAGRRLDIYRTRLTQDSTCRINPKTEDPRKLLYRPYVSIICNSGPLDVTFQVKSHNGEIEAFTKRLLTREILHLRDVSAVHPITLMGKSAASFAEAILVAPVRVVY